MKKISKFLSFMLSFALCIGLCIPVFATNGEAITSDYINSIENALSKISPEKENYGFEDTDFSDLWIGSEIPKYEFSNNSLNEANDFPTYPIFKGNGKLVALATILTEDTNVFADISTSLVKIINNCMKSADTKFSLIYDNIAAYYWDGENITLLKEYGYEIETRDTIPWDSDEEFKNLPVSTIQKEEPLFVSEYVSPIGYEDESVYINVPKISQPEGSGWCWAACMASIVNYKKGTNYTCRSMANRYTDNLYQGMTPEDVCSYLNSDFRLNYYKLDLIRTSPMFQSLGRGNPIFASFTSAFVNHGVVIRGMDYQSNTFSFMDPSDGYYHSCHLNYQSNGVAYMYFYSAEADSEFVIYGVYLI